MHIEMFQLHMLFFYSLFIYWMATATRRRDLWYLARAKVVGLLREESWVTIEDLYAFLVKDGLEITKSDALHLAANFHTGGIVTLYNRTNQHPLSIGDRITDKNWVRLPN